MEPLQRAQFIIPFITAPASLFSSIYVVHLIYRKQRARKLGSRRARRLLSNPREQILLGMSLFDISFSFALSFSTIPGPESVSQKLPTYGTVGTCSAQGFFVQLGLGAPLYNASLCIYYLLRVRYQVSDEYLMKWAIPGMHSLIFLFAAGTAMAGLSLKLFNYAGVLGCWIHNANAICYRQPEYCDRGQNADDYMLYFGLIHIALCFVFVVVAMFILWCTVRRTERRGRRWEARAVAVAATATATTSSDIGAAVEGGGNGGGSSTIHNNTTTTTTTTTTTPTRRAPIAMPLTRRTMNTGLLFSASFVAVWLPTIILGLEPPNKGLSGFYRATQIAVVVLNPLQGFLNMLIYTSPKWLPGLKQTIYDVFCCCCTGDRKYLQSTLNFSSIRPNSRYTSSSGGHGDDDRDTATGDMSSSGRYGGGGGTFQGSMEMMARRNSDNNNNNNNSSILVQRSTLLSVDENDSDDDDEEANCRTVEKMERADTTDDDDFDDDDYLSENNNNNNNRGNGGLVANETLPPPSGSHSSPRGSNDKAEKMNTSFAKMCSFSGDVAELESMDDGEAPSGGDSDIAEN